MRRPAFAPAPIRLLLWSALLCILLAWQATRIWPTPYAAAVEATRQAEDLYAEARRSQAILEAQEGAPPSALDERTGAEGAAAATAVTIPVRVIDGDTFALGAARIRIADIDTPEVAGRCAYESALAARATARLRTLLGAGPFELDPLPGGRDEDVYGRKLRIVTRGGRSLGDQLVAEGLARTWTGRREPWCV